MNGSTFFGLVFVVAGAVVLLLWPALVVMAVIWIVLGLVFIGLGFKSQGDSKRDAKLLRDGRPASATVTSIRDTGTTVNKNPRVELTLQVRPEDGPSFEVKAKRTISRLALPQVGGVYAIKYDPQHRESFVWDQSRPGGSVRGTAPSPVSTTGGDPLDRLEKLADLKAKGVLTDAEFAAEKAKILGA